MLLVPGFRPYPGLCIPAIRMPYRCSPGPAPEPGTRCVGAGPEKPVSRYRPNAVHRRSLQWKQRGI